MALEGWHRRPLRDQLPPPYADHTDYGRGAARVNRRRPPVYAQQEKRLKYNHLVANTVAIQNVIDLTGAVRALVAQGYLVRREDLAQLSPYQTRRLKRFGDYILSAGPPEPFDGQLAAPFLLPAPAPDAPRSGAVA